MLPVAVIPSYPAPSYAALASVLEQLSGVAPRFQVDVVAATFAGVASWPETESDPVHALAALHDWSKLFQLEVDLMVNDPLPYLAVLPALGVTSAVVHLHDDLPVATVCDYAKTSDIDLAVACTAATALTAVETIVKEFALNKVQLMGIAEVGKQGQPFDERVLPRVRSLRAQFPDLTIAIDGAVNETTIAQLYAAGANEFAPGSAIVAAPDPARAYKQLHALVT